MGFFIIFLVALAVCSVGFKRYIWFISIGYGFSVAAIGVALLVMFGVQGRLHVIPVIMASLAIVYGLRLGGYLLIREYRSASYHDVMQDAIENGSRVKAPLKIVTWLACALLYACEVSPILFRLDNNAANDVITDDIHVFVAC